MGIFTEEKSYEYLRSAGSRPKREKYGTGIDLLAMSVYGKTYKSSNNYFERAIIRI